LDAYGKPHFQGHVKHYLGCKDLKTSQPQGIYLVQAAIGTTTHRPWFRVRCDQLWQIDAIQEKPNYAKMGLKVLTHEILVAKPDKQKYSKDIEKEEMRHENEEKTGSQETRHENEEETGSQKTLKIENYRCDKCGTTFDMEKVKNLRQEEERLDGETNATDPELRQNLPSPGSDILENLSKSGATLNGEKLVQFSQRYSELCGAMELLQAEYQEYVATERQQYFPDEKEDIEAVVTAIEPQDD